MIKSIEADDYKIIGTIEQCIRKACSKKSRLDYVQACESAIAIGDSACETGSAFYTEAEALGAMTSFFEGYALKRLAKQVFMHDEGEVFSEDYVSDGELGVATDEAGELVGSSVARFTFKALPFGKTDKKTGFPFKVLSVEVIGEV